jgi:hypothetical protein
LIKTIHLIGHEPATFQLEAQCLNHYVTASLCGLRFHTQRRYDLPVDSKSENYKGLQIFRKAAYQMEHDDCDTSTLSQLPLALTVRETAPLLANLS